MPSLEDLTMRAKSSTEAEARLRRWLEDGGQPPPHLIRIMREWMGLTSAQFATRLGFVGANADRTVQAFESGMRDGKEWFPSSSVEMTMRALTACAMAHKLIGRGHGRDAQHILMLAIPPALR